MDKYDIERWLDRYLEGNPPKTKSLTKYRKALLRVLIKFYATIKLEEGRRNQSPRKDEGISGADRVLRGETVKAESVM